jgi:Ca2+-binding RTX toxin-like protein
MDRGDGSVHGTRCEPSPARPATETGGNVECPHSFFRPGLNRLDGKGGTDHLIGGLGNDILVGGTGDNDRLEGGAGFDTYIYNAGDGSDRIEDEALKLVLTS